MPQRGRGEIVKQDLKDKNVLVVGAGKSGIGSVGLLLNIGARPILYDGNEKLDEAEVRASLPKGAEVPRLCSERSLMNSSGSWTCAS